MDASWLDAELEELERLVEAGDTLELVGRLNAAVAQRLSTLSVEDGAGAAEATPAVKT